MDPANRASGTTRPPPRGRQENSHALPKGTLPKKLQLFFAPRLPLQYLPPMKKKKPALPYTGVAQYLSHFEDKIKEDQTSPSEKKFRNPEYAFQCRIDGETKMEKLIRMRKLRIERNMEKVKKAMSEWDPNKDTKIQGDPFKTLFVARMSYAVTERQLKKVFGEYGPIRSVRICRDSNDKSRGYAFIEYEHTSHMKDAYKNADGTKIEGRRVLVDVERGRTMEGWRPARLGGGLGAQSRRPKSKRTHRAEKPAKESERESRPRGREEHDRESGRYHDSRREEGRSRGSREYQRERDYGGHDRSRRSDRGKIEKRHYDHRSNHDESRSGKKKRELEEGEVDHGEVREMRRRERDM